MTDQAIHPSSTLARSGRLCSQVLRLKNLPPCAISLVVHMVAFLILYNMASINARRNRPIVVNTKLTEIDRDFVFTQVLEANVGEDGESPNPLAVAVAKGLEEITTERIEEKLFDPELKVALTPKIPWSSDLLMKLRNRGDGGEYVMGTGGAIDRLTLEIMRSLEERKTLVIWVMDSSLSLRPEREQIAERVDRVYRELGVMGQTKGDALLTAVVAFGEKTGFMTPKPTSDVAAVAQAIRAIKEDESGKENIFTAVLEAAKRWSTYTTRGRRNIMIIAVTDEAGDDDTHLEDCIAMLRNRMPVYVLGSAAAFGRKTVRQAWVQDEVTLMLPVDRGPESASIEWLDLPYWHGRGTGFFSSGFGSWALTRLCLETGGIYLVFKDDNRGPKFSPDNLLEYQPDYVSRQEYDQLVSRSRLRSAVLEAIRITKAKPSRPVLNFPAYSEEVKQNSLRNGQTTQAKLKYMVELGLQALAGLDEDRQREPSRRWRAHYDLLYGRLLATKVRCYTYNALCAALRKNKIKFQDQKSNAWRLVPNSKVPEDTPAGPALVKAAEEARRVLKRCVQENPGTPWAMLAQHELQYDLGFRWKETTITPPTPGKSNNNQKKNRPRPKTKTKPGPLPKL